MRIAIAEDAALLRDGLTQLLVLRGHEVVAAVPDAATLLAAVADHNPDVAVIDIRMPPTHTDEGVRAALEIQATHPHVGVLMFSQHIERRYAAQLLTGRASGVGYLLKERVVDIDEFVDALVRVASGGTALDPEVVTQLLGANQQLTGLTRLTPREREVLELMAEGRANTEISTALVVSNRAVEKHIANIFTKLDLPPTDTGHRRVLAVLHYLDL